jgi:hypothetical protein
MKPIAPTLLILASVLAVHFASGASSPDRPAGVDSQNWIPVSDKMGFVVTTPAYTRSPQWTSNRSCSRRRPKAILWCIPGTLGSALSSKTPSRDRVRRAEWP